MERQDHVGRNIHFGPYIVMSYTPHCKRQYVLRRAGTGWCSIFSPLSFQSSKFKERGHKDRKKIKNGRQLYNAACASSNSASDTQYRSTFRITRKKEKKSSETSVTPGETNGD